MLPEKTRLIFKADLKRSYYFRRFLWMVVAVIAAGAAWWALKEVGKEDAVESQVLTLGKAAAIVAVVLLSLRGIWHLLRWFTTKSESIRILNKGLQWQRGKKSYKYGWTQIRTFREGVRVRRFLGRTLLKSGAHTIVTRDNQTFKFKPKHGDTERFAKAVRPYIEDVMGTAMGQALRNSKSVKLHPQLAMDKDDVMVGKEKISWSAVDVQVKNGYLTIFKLNDAGEFKKVKRYPTSQIDNLAGFLDVAHSVIRNRQPKRFNIKTQV